MEAANLFTFEMNGIKEPVRSFSICHSLDSPCAQFQCVVSDLGSFHKKLGQDITITHSGRTRYGILDALDCQWPRETTLSGRDQTSLLVDSSVRRMGFTGGQSFLVMAQKITEPFGIGVKDPDHLGGFTLNQVQVSPGDSAYEVLIQWAQMGGVTLTTENGKDLVLHANKPTSYRKIDRHSPVLSLQVSQNVADLFSTYECIVESHEFFGTSKKISHQDKMGHPKKLKIFSPLDDETKALRFLKTEALRRREESQSVHLSFPGIETFCLGAGVEVDLPGYFYRGIIKAWNQSMDESGRAQTQISLGAL